MELDDVTIYIVYAFAAGAGIMFAEAAYVLLSSGAETRKAVNRRMRLQQHNVNQKEVLVQLRKERGLDGEGARFSPLAALRALRIQSGMVMPLTTFLVITSLIALAIGLGGGFFINRMQYGIMVGVALIPVVPVMLLRWLRKKRHKRFGLQLPEALDLITRGLKAGHPVPVAVSMVSREMPDPIGTEFGIVTDEITYGSDMVSALRNLYERVGHEDLPLFVTAVSIQSTTGGNLREILEGLSGVIRERGKLRRKVKAISVEGRMSAYILTAVPVLLVLAVMVLMPSYYREVAGEGLTWYLAGGSFGWLVLGNAIMFKMANFRF
ncbi:type II secretion system F family protein [Oricola sp.]|uniref:type II secretion system F family protein n=1 Tax=Oricola sp. TaxID=1979950 RepID=UPI0025DA1A13|nr:type II secretion system F family protein [Oricola sp.]MCI5073906.1 type II secretion system F family protein [Oricola sp.]